MIKKYFPAVVVGVFVVGLLVVFANENMGRSVVKNESAVIRAQRDFEVQQAVVTARAATLKNHRKVIEDQNADIKSTIAAYKSASVSSKALFKEALRTKLETRKTDFVKMMHDDPQAAYLSALSSADYVDVPTDLRDTYIEKETTLTGEVRVFHGHKTLPNGQMDPDSSVYDYYMDPGNKIVRLNIAGLEMKKVKTLDGIEAGDSVTATGFQIDNNMVLPTAQLQLAYTGGSGNTNSQTQMNNGSGLHNHKVLSIVANWSDRPGEYNVNTVTQIQNIMNGTGASVNNFFIENSYGVMNMADSTVVGPYATTIDSDGTSCQPNAPDDIGYKAVQIAQSQGINISQYENIIVFHPYTGRCPFTGAAWIGTPTPPLDTNMLPSVWMNGGLLSGGAVVTHELGHNLGLPHAHGAYKDRYTSCVYGSSDCTGLEYGDVFDTMGSAVDFHHFNPVLKDDLGWLNFGSAPTIGTITGTGDYTLSRYETAGAGAHAYYWTNPITNRKFFFDYRAGYGFDAGVNGVTVRFNGITAEEQNTMILNGMSPEYTQFYTMQETYLIDVKPETNSMYDSLLAPGQSFTDPVTGTTFSVTSMNATSATLHVTAGTSCSRKPNISITPVTQSGAGLSFTNTVTATNMDLTGCPPATFTIKPMLGGGKQDSSYQMAYNLHAPYTVTLAPGASDTRTTVTTKIVGGGGIGVPIQFGSWIENTNKPELYNSDIYTITSNSNDSTYPVLSNIHVTDINMISGTINWTTDDFTTGEVRYGLTPGNHQLSAGFQRDFTTTHSATITGPTTATTYYYVVKSKNENGLETVSPEYSFTTLPGTLDTNVPVVTVTSPTSGQVVSGPTTFSANVTDNGNITQVKFYLYYPGVGNSPIGTDTTAPYSVTFDPGSTNPEEKILVVKAWDDAVPSANIGISQMIPFTADNNIFYSYGTTVSNVTSTTATINWNTNRLATGQVMYGLDTAYPFSSAIDTPSLTHSATITGLSPNTLYHFATKQTANGKMTVSGDNTFTTSSVSSNAPILSNLSVVPTSSGATVSWNTNIPASTQVSYGIDTGYGGLTSFVATPVTLHSATISGLAPSTTYHFRVTSVANGQTANSPDQTFTTTGPLDTTPPSAPTSLVSTAKTSTSVALSWGSSSDNIGVAGYQVLKNGTVVGTTVSTTYNVTGLTANTIYSFTVKAYDAATPTPNYSLPSNTLSVTTNPIVVTSSISITSPIAYSVSGTTLSGVVPVSVAVTGPITTVKYFKYYGGTQFGSSSIAPNFTYSWNTSATGSTTNTLIAKGYDSAGNLLATSATVKVKIVNAVVDTTAPTVILATPPATLSGIATLSATASDAGGISKVEFYRGTTKIGEDSSSPYSTSWNTTSVANGPYSLSAKAYDLAGNTGTSASVSVTVTNIVVPNNAPVVDITAESVTVSKAVNNHMYASVTDTDGPAPLTILWSKVSGPSGATVTMANPSQPTSNVSFSATGTYVLRLTATDGLGATSIDNITMVVTE